MPELTQAMIDAGATFFDQNGVPTKPDGTPIEGWSYSGDPIGVLGAISQSQNPYFNPRVEEDMAQALREELLKAGDPGQLEREKEGPAFRGFGPTYEESAARYDPNRTPTTLANFGLPEDWDYRDDPGWLDLKSRDRSTGGGFFTADDIFGGGVEGSVIPSAFQSGSNMPSTNNYRLLPLEFRDPRFILRNGNIIDLHADLIHPFNIVTLAFGSGAPNRQPSSIGPGVWTGFNYTAQGWPGSVTPWNATPYRQG